MTLNGRPVVCDSALSTASLMVRSRFRTGMMTLARAGQLSPGFARGTGLGLSIVHRIVSDYGGELQVTSQPGQGTTVTVRLPLAAPPAGEPAGAAA